MSKSQKVHISFTFLLITFFAAFAAFFDTHIEFLENNFFLFLLALFLNFDCKCAGNGSKKRKIFFL
jgi:hypothetical protein